MIHVADRGSAQAPDAPDASKTFDTPDKLKALVHANWGLRVLHLQPLPSGHTNKTYLVEVDGGDAGRDADNGVGTSHAPLILRVSWPGKAVQQVDREEALLVALGTSGFLPSVPRALLTLDGRSYVQAEASWVHLFDYIPGRTGFPPHASQGAEIRNIAAAAMRTLAHLHTAMGNIPTGAADAAPHSATWLVQRYARVSARAMPVLPGGLAPHYAEVVARAGAYLAEAASSLPGPTGWVHGDYHAGNLLFAKVDSTDVSVTGILDFDDVGIGAPWLEAAFALFALARDATVEHAFAYDASVWELGLTHYSQQRQTPDAEAMTQHLRVNRNALMNLFCIDQILIHLEAAQRGLWSLGPGIGFLGCWHQLLSDASPSSILTASTVAGRASP